jgi:hypothetical protein
MRHGGGARLRRRILLVGLAAATLGCPLAAAGPQAAAVEGLPEVAVSVADLGDSTMRLEGRFQVNGSSANAWSVLTDYDHIPSFVASMRSSHVKERGDGFLLVDQESVGRMFLFRRTFRVLLKVREAALRSIAFEDVSKVSFQRYEGAWTLQETRGGMQVGYLLTVKGALVGFMTRGPSQKMVRDLLEQVRAEIDRRAAAAVAALAAPPGHSNRSGGDNRRP